MDEQLIYLLNRGESKYQAGDFWGAIDVFSNVIELNAELPIPFFAYFGRGQAKSGMKNYVGAINDYSRAIEYNPHNLYYYDCCIEAYERLNDSEGVQIMKEKKLKQL